ncbi:hypothetical protein D3P06_00345 [Paracoccus aestuarii]|uniref:Uncharacterized protein n=1 Tax=Paracoccus aestuarii TaxID=453842 RepID=A0A419A2Z0_9RHOB|nr:hypothetical protein [Paracoccus aestuarii]RJL07555.1 hypothetical protein D3P06_00345 [Paracoccus aestuarii]WCQ99026.1 hypothetical protein JHW48_14445 [Paracoccus aestuarii]
MTLEHLMQGLLLAACLGLGVFCLTLTRRLRKLNDLESGLGGAIAVMAAEVDRLERAIRQARDEAMTASERLAEEIETARRERAIWDLRQRIGAAASEAPAAATGRRLRKREVHHG